MPRFPAKQREKDKKSSGAARVVKSANDYLNDGLENEEGGERWSASDKRKSARFYIKAIECYSQALQADPNEKDAAYNRARVQLALGVDEELWPEVKDDILPGGAIGMLQEALNSHLICLKLGMDEDQDVMFNTGQAYIALAEELLNENGDSREEGLQHVLKGIEYFDAAYTLQEAQLGSALSHVESEMMDVDNENGGVKLNESPEPEGTMDSKVEAYRDEKPITKFDLIDTLMATLQALTLICTYLSIPSTGLLTEIIQTKAPQTITGLQSFFSEVASEATDELCTQYITCVGNFKSACADAQFKRGLLTPAEFVEIVSNIYPNEDTNPVIVTHKAETYVLLAQSLLKHHDRVHADHSNTPLLRSVLTHYTTAATLLTAASKLQPPPPAQLHLLRGDLEFFKSRIFIRLFPTAPLTQLRKNAGIYYRGAYNCANSNYKAHAEIRREAKVKEGLSEIELGVESDDQERVEKGLNMIIAEGDCGEILREAIRIGIIADVAIRVLRIGPWDLGVADEGN